MITFVTDPDTASVKVVDTDNVEIAPIAGGSGKTFLLSSIGGSYGVNVKKEGYTGKHITIANNKRPNFDGRTGRESSRLKFIGNK